MQNKFYDLIVIGGGAAGFFAALRAKELDSSCKVLLIEKSSHLLNKVRISGGGRCNVTHACFDPVQLTRNYPRGNKALIGPFTRFQPRDTIDWYQARGVELKTEEDGRIFPVTDSSQTIIDCLLREAAKLKVEICLKKQIENINRNEETGHFTLELADSSLECARLILATGSSPQGWAFAQKLGHTIQPPVPSLFTFNVPNSPLLDLLGVVANPVEIQIAEGAFIQKGPLLLTHWGFSGPAALKLSAWAARWLFEKQYQVSLQINWVPEIKREAVLNTLRDLRKDSANIQIGNTSPFNLPKKLWKRLLELSQIDLQKRMGEINNEMLERITARLTSDTYQVNGKTTNKEEFVTCGGITLAEVNFKTMESKVCPNLYFAGEVLDIDGVTGGFNFQNAWTTGWIAGG